MIATTLAITLIGLAGSSGIPNASLTEVGVRIAENAGPEVIKTSVHSTYSQSRKNHESFWSPQNTLFQIANLGAGVYDVQTTRRCLALTTVEVRVNPDGSQQNVVTHPCTETNRWVVPAARSGAVPQYALKVVAVESILTGSYFARRSSNRLFRYVVGWGVPLGAVALQVWAGNHNTAVRKSIEARR